MTSEPPAANQLQWRDTARRCVVYVASTSLYLAHSRIPLLRYMRDRGWRVIVVAPEDDSTPRLLDLGIEFRPLPIAREIGAAARHGVLVRRLADLYRRERPVLVHHFTANPILYGSLAAWLARVPATVNSVTGTGTVFTSTRWDAPLLRAWLRFAHRRASRLGNSRTIFQNADDMRTFVSTGLVPPQRATLVRSSGIDIDLFVPTPEPPGVPVILFSGRMLWHKGIAELIAATRLLREWKVPCRVQLAGRVDPSHRNGVPRERIEAWHRQGDVEWLGRRTDMPRVLGQSHIVTLGSHGGEGLPRSLIEAAACARPIVATDVPGCREIVSHGRNGFLVPPRDPRALAESLAVLARDPALRREFGMAGRELAANGLSQQAVIAATVAVYRALVQSAIE